MKAYEDLLESLSSLVLSSSGLNWVRLSNVKIRLH
jgi:hypothetical protein